LLSKKSVSVPCSCLLVNNYSLPLASKMSLLYILYVTEAVRNAGSGGERSASEYYSMPGWMQRMHLAVAVGAIKLF